MGEPHAEAAAAIMGATMPICTRLWVFIPVSPAAPPTIFPPSEGSADLRKNKPHPVCPFSPARQFSDDLTVDRGLRRPRKRCKSNESLMRYSFHIGRNWLVGRAGLTVTRCTRCRPITSDSECPAIRSNCQNDFSLEIDGRPKTEFSTKKGVERRDRIETPISDVPDAHHD